MRCPVWEFYTQHVLWWWTCIHWTLVSHWAGGFAQLWNSALLGWNYLLFLFFIFLSLQGLQGLVLTVALVGTRATHL